MKRTFEYALVAMVVLAAILVAEEAVAQGCAMCKTALGGPGDPLSKGINTSILFMMAMPFVLFTVVGGWLTYMLWDHRPDTAVGEEAVQRPDLKPLGTAREGSR